MRLLASILLCFATLAGAQPGVEPVAVPITIQPSQTLSFLDAPDIGSVAFSPDGKTMYVHSRPSVIDVWAMLVYAWPEELGALVGLAAVIAGLLMWRARRRPQRKGVLHCRKCNYDLSGMPGGAGTAKCSECGVDLARKRPRRGRTAWRRAGPIGVALVIIASGYAAMWAAGLPRRGRASSWMTWLSPSLYQAAQARGITWLTGFESRVDRVVAIDTATGRIVRTICTRSGITWFPIKVLPDGSGLFLADTRAGLVLIDTDTGRARAKLSPALPDTFGAPQSDTVVGFADHGRVVYAVGLSQDRSKTRVYEWDLASGASRVVHETEASGYIPRRVMMLPGEPGARFLVAPAFMEAYKSKNYTLWFTGPGMESRQPIQMPSVTSPSGDPVVTPDGTRLFASAMSRGVVGMDLVTGESLGVLSPGGMEPPLDELALSPDGDLLFVSVHPNSILVRRLSARAWVARLPYPSPLIAPKLFVSPDGRWLAAVPFRGMAGVRGSRGPYVHEVLVYDLTSIPGRSGSDAE